MMILILLKFLFSSNEHKDTVRITIDSIGSLNRLSIVGELNDTVIAKNRRKQIQNIIREFDKIIRENECDDFSSDTLDLHIITENTNNSKNRWVRVGPIYPYGEKRINELMKLTKRLNPLLHPDKIYKIQYLRYCKSMRAIFGNSQHKIKLKQ
jgi:hypothetical protein